MTLFSYRAACLLAALSFAPAAPADAATLTINGRVLPGTCTLAAPAVTLDPIKADQLVVGDNALKAGTLNFTGCVGVRAAKLSFAGTAATGDAQRWQNTAPDAAMGVTVALKAGTTGNTYLKAGDSNINVTVSGTTASYALRAGYYVPAVAAARAGAVQAQITVTAAYE